MWLSQFESVGNPTCPQPNRDVIRNGARHDNPLLRNCVDILVLKLKYGLRLKYGPAGR